MFVCVFYTLHTHIQICKYKQGGPLSSAGLPVGMSSQSQSLAGQGQEGGHHQQLYQHGEARVHDDVIPLQRRDHVHRNEDDVIMHCLVEARYVLCMFLSIYLSTYISIYLYTYLCNVLYIHPMQGIDEESQLILTPSQLECLVDCVLKEAAAACVGVKELTDSRSLEKELEV